MFMPNSLWTWSFFFVGVLQALICLALEAYVFGEFESSVLWDTLDGSDVNIEHLRAQAKSIPTYLAIFIFGFIYQIVLIWDAERLKNTIQVIGLCLYNLGMVIYAAVQMDQVVTVVDALGTDHIVWDQWLYVKGCLTAVPCVIGAGTVMMSFIAWKLYTEFAWTIYKHISADLRLKRRYLTYQIYIALLKFDFFFFLGYTVQFLVIAIDIAVYELVLTIAALPITVILLFLAAYFTRRESYTGQSLIIFLYFAGMAYFIFKLVRMYDPFTGYKYQAARNPLTTFAVLTILLLVATITTAVMCMMNFNKGLRPHIQKRKVLDADDPKYSNYGPNDGYGSPHQHRMDSVPSRMTID